MCQITFKGRVSTRNFEGSVDASLAPSSQVYHLFYRVRWPAFSALTQDPSFIWNTETIRNFGKRRAAKLPQKKKFNLEDSIVHGHGDAWYILITHKKNENWKVMEFKNFIFQAGKVMVKKNGPFLVNKLKKVWRNNLVSQKTDLFDNLENNWSSLGH